MVNVNDFEIYSKDGSRYVRSLSPPYYIGKVVSFRNDAEMLSWVAEKVKKTGICIAGKVPECCILVIYSGADDTKELPDSSVLFHLMAAYFFEQKIKFNKRRYKKQLQ